LNPDLPTYSLVSKQTELPWLTHSWHIKVHFLSVIGWWHCVVVGSSVDISKIIAAIFKNNTLPLQHGTIT
jgi:hypothetical protein